MKRIITCWIFLIFVTPLFAGDFYVGVDYIAADEDNTDGDGISASLGYMFKGKKNINHCVQLEFGTLDMEYKEEAQLIEAINSYYGSDIEDLPAYDITPYLLSYKCIFPLMDRVHGFAKIGGGIVRAEILGRSDTATAVEAGLGVQLMANESFGIYIEYDFMKMDDLSESVDDEEYTLEVGDINIIRCGCILYF
jgi:hypothetical protein